MTFLTRVDRQFMLRNWISRNLKPIKRFNMYYGDSRILLRLAKENDERLADIDHEEFKQAMARCGFYADTSYTDEHCTSLIYNVSTRSVKKAYGEQETGSAQACTGKPVGRVAALYPFSESLKGQRTKNEQREPGRIPEQGG